MAHDHDGEIHIDEEDVSGGSKEGVVRWILGIGLLLAIVAMSLIWIIPAMTQSEEEADISSRSGTPEAAMPTEEDGTDGILTEENLGEGGDDAATTDLETSSEPAEDNAVGTPET